MRASVNRTQLLVVGFFAAVWVALVAILLLAPDVYAASLRGLSADGFGTEASLPAALTALIALLVVGVLRRWRWTFWLVLIAFALGLLRIPAAALELAGVVPATGPAWYEVLQGVIGAAQFGIAIAMIAGYRKRGVWGEF